MRFFIDENLSPSLVQICQEAGYEATSVRDRGMLNATDRQVSELCFEEDRILVINNAVDFLDLAEESGIHPGLVFVPLGSGAETRTSMRMAIEEIERFAAEATEEPESLMVNSVLEVAEDVLRQIGEGSAGNLLVGISAVLGEQAQCRQRGRVACLAPAHRGRPAGRRALADLAASFGRPALAGCRLGRSTAGTHPASAGRSVRPLCRQS